MRAQIARKRSTDQISRAPYDASRVPASPAIPNSAIVSTLDSIPSTRIDLGAVMRGRMEERFGVKLDGMKTFADSGLSAVGQLGYSQGNEIHIDGSLGGSRRDEVLMHEAGHVVQSGAGLAHGTGLLQSSSLESGASAGFAAPANFSMPTGASGPIQGFSGWNWMKKLYKKEQAQPTDSKAQEMQDSPEAPPMTDNATTEAAAGAIDDNEDAAAEQKGFLGGLGRRLLNPFRFVGSKLQNLGRTIRKKVFRGQYFKMDDDALKYSSMKYDNSKIGTGDALYDMGANDEIGSGSYQSTIAPAISTVATLGAAGMTGANVIGKLGNRVNEIGGGSANILSGALNASVNIMNAGSNYKSGNYSDAASSGLQAGADIVGTASAATNAIAGAGAVASGALPGLGMVGGALQSVKGAVDFTSGKETQDNMTNLISRFTDKPKDKASVSDNFSEAERRRMLRTMHMAREMGAIKKESGVWDATAGTMKMAGNAITLSGLGGIVGTGLSGVGSLVGAVGGMNKSMQIEDMRDRVVEQELNLDKYIADFDTELGEEKTKFDAETKERIVLQRMGYKSGTRKEVFMNIAMNRSKMLTDTANSKNAALADLRKDKRPKSERNGEETRLRGEDKYNWDGKEDLLEEYRRRKFARSMLSGMGLSKVKSADAKNVYTQQAAAESLGMDSGVDINWQLKDSQAEESDYEIETKKLTEEIAQLKKPKTGLFASTKIYTNYIKRKLEEKEAQLAHITGTPRP